MVLKPLSSIVDQVYDILATRIQAGTYPKGSKLPSETELGKEFGVSRSTIREAIKKLEARREIYKLHGIGTYVSETAAIFTFPPQRFLDLKTLIEKTGHRCSMEASLPIFRLATQMEAQNLNLADSLQVAELYQLYYADDVPVLHISYVLPLARLKQNIKKEDIDAGLSFPEILETCFIGSIGSSKTVVHSTIDLPEVDRNLKLDTHLPAVRLLDTFFDRQGQPMAMDIIDINDHEIDWYVFYIYE